MYWEIWLAECPTLGLVLVVSPEPLINQTVIVSSILTNVPLLWPYVCNLSEINFPPVRVRAQVKTWISKTDFQKSKFVDNTFKAILFCPPPDVKFHKKISAYISGQFPWIFKKKEKSNEKKSCKNNANSNINKFYIETCFKFKNLLLFCSKLAIPKTGWPLALRK